MRYSINSKVQSAQAFAPATCSNIWVGFDLLGFPMSQVGDSVQVSVCDEPGVHLSIEGLGKDMLPHKPRDNVASAVIIHALETLPWRESDKDIKKLGFHVHLTKGIPLCSGMGGSAASSVAAMLAFNEWIEPKLSLSQWVELALYGEQVASGARHGDNVVPCAYGGFNLVQSTEPLRVIALPIPKVWVSLVHPDMAIKTADARAMLQAPYELAHLTEQASYLASFMSALYDEDTERLSKSLVDVTIEPRRSHLIPGFEGLKAMAIQQGAMSLSISGAGPSLLAFSETQDSAHKVADSVVEGFKDQGLSSQAWVGPMSAQGAIITELKMHTS